MTLVLYILKSKKCVILLFIVHLEYKIMDSEKIFKMKIIKYYNNS